jgi:hypothetical protein
MAELLASAGLDPSAAEQARHALIVYTIGSAAYATAPTSPDGPSITPEGDRTRAAFESGLKWLLVGMLERRAMRQGGCVISPAKPGS